MANVFFSSMNFQYHFMCISMILDIKKRERPYDYAPFNDCYSDSFSPFPTTLASADKIAIKKPISFVIADGLNFIRLRD